MWLLQQKHPTSDGLGANAQCKNAVTKLLRSRSVVIKYQCRNEQNQEGRTLSVVLCGGSLQFFRQAAVTACRAAAVKKKGVKAGTEIPKNTSNHSSYLEESRGFVTEDELSSPSKLVHPQPPKLSHRNDDTSLRVLTMMLSS